MTLQGTIDGTPEIEDEIRAGVAERIGKFARPKRIIFADDLPKTRSGKIMRRLLGTSPKAAHSETSPPSATPPSWPPSNKRSKPNKPPPTNR